MPLPPPPRPGLARPVHLTRPSMPILVSLALALQLSSPPAPARASVPPAQQPGVTPPAQQPGATPLSGPTAAAADAQLAQAEARYRTAIAATPSIAAYHESLALILEREGRLDEALAAHREAVSLDSSAVRGRAGLGTLLLRLGRPAEAIPHLQGAARLDPGSVETRKLLAAALLSQSRRSDAIAALQEAQRLDTADVDVRRALAAAQAAPAGVPSEAESAGARAHRAIQAIRQVLQGAFAIALGVAGLVLLAPLLSGLALLFIQLPRHLLHEIVR